MTYPTTHSGPTDTETSPDDFGGLGGLSAPAGTGGGGPSAKSMSKSQGLTKNPPKSSGDSIDSLSVDSNFDDANTNFYNKSQNKGKSKPKSATKSTISGFSRKSTGKSAKDPPTKLRTKICIGVTLLLGLVLIAVLAWLAKSKLFTKSRVPSIDNIQFFGHALLT